MLRRLISWARGKGSTEVLPPGPPPVATRSGVFAATLAGGATRHYDPMKVRADLSAALPDWAEAVDLATKAATPLPAAIQAADPTAEPKRRAAAEAKIAALAAACRQAFDLPPLAADGSGFATGECLAVLTAYLDYCAGLLERTRPL